MGASIHFHFLDKHLFSSYSESGLGLHSPARRYQPSGPGHLSLCNRETPLSHPEPLGCPGALAGGPQGPRLPPPEALHPLGHHHQEPWQQQQHQINQANQCNTTKPLALNCH